PGSMALTALAAAHHALDRVGRLRRGETVLVHGAETPLGLAALRIAERLGATAYVTAPTKAQRSHLRGLGAADAFDSSSAIYVDRLLEATEGRGVDVVLNLTAGELGVRAMHLLAPFGRYLDMAGALAGDPLALKRLKPNRGVTAIDAPGLIAAEPDVFQASLAAVLADVENGLIGAPALPAPIVDEAGRAPQDEGSARWRVTDHAAARAAEPVEIVRPGRIDPEATYLVTGGYGGFGFELARRLGERGARHLP
ncbi:MDR/SDR family oxidoreductase, partial [Methylopila musalis]